jgi:hypothetical protein
MRDVISYLGARRAIAVAALGALLAGGGCNLSHQQTPDLTGPADQGFNLELEALPDILNADGVSTARIRVVVRNQDGQPVTGYSVLIQHDGDGVLRPDPGSTFVGPIQTGGVMATDNNGVAFMIYTAGLAIRTVTVGARPYNFDGASYYLRTVQIQQQ